MDKEKKLVPDTPISDKRTKEKLDRLAQILLEIYFDEQCQKTDHAIGRCEECRDRRFNPPSMRDS